MREVIEINGSSHWKSEHQKILDLIHQREELIGKQNGSMIITEVWLQAIYQLMQEERIPLLIRKSINNTQTQ